VATESTSGCTELKMLSTIYKLLNAGLLLAAVVYGSGR
jgi:hypothetical protein